MDVEALLAAAKAGPSCGGEEELLKAARGGDAVAIADVLRRNPNVNLECRGDFDGMSPIHWAAEKDCLEGVQALLEAGAKVDARDANKWTPLMCAVQKNHHRTAALLLASRLRPRIDNVFQAASRKVRAAEEEVLQPIGDALPFGHQSVGHPVRRGLGIGIVVVTVVVMGAGAGMA